jgi:hypothetical protein
VGLKPLKSLNLTNVYPNNNNKNNKNNNKKKNNKVKSKPLELRSRVKKPLIFEIPKKVFHIQNQCLKVVGTSFTEMFAANDWKPF